ERAGALPWNARSHRADTRIRIRAVRHDRNAGLLWIERYVAHGSGGAVTCAHGLDGRADVAGRAAADGTGCGPIHANAAAAEPGDGRRLVRGSGGSVCDERRVPGRTGDPGSEGGILLLAAMGNASGNLVCSCRDLLLSQVPAGQEERQ